MKEKEATVEIDDPASFYILVFNDIPLSYTAFSSERLQQLMCIEHKLISRNQALDTSKSHSDMDLLTLNSIQISSLQQFFPLITFGEHRMYET